MVMFAGAAEILRVVAAPCLALAADLHQELAGARELQDLRVLLAAAAEPHVLVLVDVDAVLEIRPLIAVARAAPRLTPGCPPYRIRAPAARCARSSASRSAAASTDDGRSRHGRAVDGNAPTAPSSHWLGSGLGPERVLLAPHLPARRRVLAFCPWGRRAPPRARRRRHHHQLGRAQEVHISSAGVVGWHQNPGLLCLFRTLLDQHLIAAAVHGTM